MRLKAIQEVEDGGEINLGVHRSRKMIETQCQKRECIPDFPCWCCVKVLPLVCYPTAEFCNAVCK